MASLVITAVFFVALGALGFLSPFAWVLLSVYLVLSAATFVAYAADKRAAQRGRWRTKESSLHVMSLLGGWPGALAAQRVYRHKSSKRSFQFVYRATVVANVAGSFWLILR